MTSKIIIGVAHNSEKELTLVMEKIGKYYPSAVGLELPEDYQEREFIYGLRYFLFSDIAERLKDNGVGVIPLEKPALFDYARAVDIVKKIREGLVNKKDIEKEIALIEKKDFPYIAGELISASRLLMKRYKNVLTIVNNTRNLEEVLSLWETSNRNREGYMKQKIKYYQPEIVVIGNAHANVLKRDFSEYTYIAIK